MLAGAVTAPGEWKMTDDENTGRRRRLPTLDDDEDLAKRVRRIELLGAEIFGRDGDGGRFADMEDDMKAVKNKVMELETFKTKALVYISVLAVVGGFFAAVASKAFSKLLGL